MKKVFSVILCLVMLLALTGCGSKQDAIIGTWEGSYDMSESLNAGMSSQDPELGEYLRVSEFALRYTMTFREDGTYTIAGDRESLEEAIAIAQVEIEEGLIKYIEYILHAQGIEMDAREFMEMAGLSVEALMEDSFSESIREEIMASLTMEGNYSVKDGMLMLSQDLTSQPDEAVYELYSIEGDTLTIDKGTAETVDAALEMIYPMVLVKIS